jgi:hypothetical protein
VNKPENDDPSNPANRTGHFPPPWIVDEHTESFIVRDATGQMLGYFYFDDERQR